MEVGGTLPQKPYFQRKVTFCHGLVLSEQQLTNHNYGLYKTDPRDIISLRCDCYCKNFEQNGPVSHFTWKLINVLTHFQRM